MFRISFDDCSLGVDRTSNLGEDVNITINAGIYLYCIPFLDYTPHSANIDKPCQYWCPCGARILLMSSF